MSDTSVADDVPEDLPDEIENEVETVEDDGDEVSEVNDEADEEEGSEDLDEPAPRQTARKPASDKFRETRARAQQAEREAKETKEKAERLERELADLRATRNAGPSEAEQAAHRAAEEQRLALMTPEERTDYRFDQLRRENAMERNRDRMNMQEQADAASFRSLQATNPVAKKYAADVEKLVAAEKGKGMIVPREVALKFLLGEKMLERASTGTAKDKKAAAARVDSAKTRPTRSGGDTASDRGRKTADFDERAFERKYGNERF